MTLQEYFNSKDGQPVTGMVRQDGKELLRIAKLCNRHPRHMAMIATKQRRASVNLADAIVKHTKGAVDFEALLRKRA